MSNVEIWFDECLSSFIVVFNEMIHFILAHTTKNISPADNV